MADKAAVVAELGREIRVFLRPAAIESTPQSISEQDEPAAGFYEFTAEDYARVMSHKKEDKVLKTKKHRDAEIQARRARITKAIVRVQFPDSIVLEANFSSKDAVSDLLDLLKKVIVHPEAAFHIYTTPPKQILKDPSATMYEAGLAPGGIVYFSYTESTEGPYLKEGIAALLEVEDTNPKPLKPLEDSQEQAPVSQPVKNKTSTGKPKWLRLGK